jgi:hypothetical protein
VIDVKGRTISLCWSPDGAYVAALVLVKVSRARKRREAASGASISCCVGSRAGSEGRAVHRGLEDGEHSASAAGGCTCRAALSARVWCHPSPRTS